MAKLVKGDKMPNFTVDTAFENGVSFEKIVGGKPTMFVVLRYIGCTVCRYDVHVLTERYSEFTAKGVNVAVVMQSTPEMVQKDLDGATLPFYLICDSKQEVYKTLSIDAAPDMPSLVGADMAGLQAKGAKAAAAGFKHGEYEGIEEQLP
ncbi:MAG: redoxin domain-containing protein, partial [Oscillospiraceae bacterium]